MQGEILVTTFPTGGGDIYAFDPDSVSILNIITLDAAAEVSASFSPDGTRIAYISTVSLLPKIYVADADGSNPRQLNDNANLEGSPAWTADGGGISPPTKSMSNLDRFWAMSSVSPW